MASIYRHSATPVHDRLLIFFTGWGMDERQTAHLADDSCDVWTVSDYTAPVVLPAIPARYRSCLLVAWSLGVWAAAEAAPSLPSALDAAIAINGTLTPIDERDGIPPAIFTGTGDNWIDPRARQRFLLRMTGTPQSAEAFPPQRRTPLEQQRELQSIACRAAAPRATPLPNPFSCALIATRDRIFPADAQRNAWRRQLNTRIREFDASHAPFANFASWSELLAFAGHARQS
ncbi:MAG: alpha/beta fold hydrolase [Kiritimatiellia bacterium]